MRPFLETFLDSNVYDFTREESSLVIREPSLRNEEEEVQLKRRAVNLKIHAGNR